METMETAAAHPAAHVPAYASAVPDALPLTLDYPVFCAAGTLPHLAAIVQQVAPAHRIAVISDDTVAAVHAPQVMAQFDGSAASLFTIPPGEQEKTRERWASLTDALVAWGAGRDTTIVALGGGVICDLSGFVAATYMRGLPVVQVPTTLLAMVDASVGGKTAVDTPAGKNLVGAFHNPAAVVIDPQVLASLPPAILRSGLAEMIKHGVIADVAYFDRLLQALPSLLTLGAHAPEFGALIAGSVRIKAAVVAEDGREGGLRQILNFGHTSPMRWKSSGTTTCCTATPWPWAWWPKPGSPKNLASPLPASPPRSKTPCSVPASSVSRRRRGVSRGRNPGDKRLGRSGPLRLPAPWVKWTRRRPLVRAVADPIVMEALAELR